MVDTQRTAEDGNAVPCAVIGIATGTCREIQGHRRRRKAFPDAQLQQDEHISEKDCGNMQHQTVGHVSHCKTWRIFFLVKIQVLTIFRSLIGNDLETSKILYFTSFCSNSKERFS